MIHKAKYLLGTIVLVIAALAFAKNNEKVKDVIRSEEDFNNGWTFSKDSSIAEVIDIPHVFRIEPLVVNDQWQGSATYIKEFEMNRSIEEKVFIRFEGVMHEAEIFLNGSKLLIHKGGYTPFCIDISDHLLSGKNWLQVKVNNEDNSLIPPGKALNNLDFNYYGGIYRDVKLIKTNQVYITDPIITKRPAKGGQLFHFSDVTENKAVGEVQVNVKNESDKRSEVYLELILTDIYEYEHIVTSEKISLSPGADKIFSLRLDLKAPLLWSTTHPNLYRTETRVYTDDHMTDQLMSRIGIRKIELDDNGFSLNGEKTYLRGTNRHQEYPYVGYAISNEAQYRDAVKIKEAGFDFVRLSHYPQDEAFLDACDELGIMVMDAIPGWQYFEEGEFVQNSYQDIRSMVRNDRNHPSIVFWEVSLNESGMSEEYMITANKILKEELPFEDTYSAGWIDHPAFDLYIPARQHAKAPNYWNKYKNGTRNILISEYGDWEYYAQNAGFNQNAFEGLKEEERTSRQLREFGEKRLLQQALNFQEAANSNRMGGKNIIGHANWLMFDYNRGYSNDLEASGISDIFRIPKFAKYFYQSQRKPQSVALSLERFYEPFVKIASYWSSKSSKDIVIYSNCEEVELFLNNKSQGRQKPNVDKFSSHLESAPFAFRLNDFIPGKLEAVAYINDGVVASEIVHTASNPTQIKIEVSKSDVDISESQNDYLFVYAKVVDQNGTIIYDSSVEVTFYIHGEGQLIGENPVTSKGGIASILLKTSLDFKQITVDATGENLIHKSIQLNR